RGRDGARGGGGGPGRGPGAGGRGRGRAVVAGKKAPPPPLTAPGRHAARLATASLAGLAAAGVRLATGVRQRRAGAWLGRGRAGQVSEQLVEGHVQLNLGGLAGPIRRAFGGDQAAAGLLEGVVVALVLGAGV